MPLSTVSDEREAFRAEVDSSNVFVVGARTQVDEYRAQLVRAEFECDELRRKLFHIASSLSDALSVEPIGL